MGSVVKAVGGLFGGGGGGAGPTLDARKFDLKKQVEDRTQASRDASLDLQKQLLAQTRGQAPSLADVQLKSAQDRNLSQLLAMSAAQRGGNAAARQRQISQNQGQMARQIAQDSATLRLQEQQQAQQLLAQQALGQQGQDLSQVMQPGQLAAQGEQARFNADVEKQRQIKEQQGGVLSGLLGAGGAVLGSLVAPGIGTAIGAQLGSSLGGGKAGSFSVPSEKYSGGTIKPKGDSSKNDVVAAKLSPGEMVIPRTVVSEGADAIKSFADAILQKQAETPEKEVEGFGAIIAAQQELEKRLNKLEKKKK